MKRKVSLAAVLLLSGAILTGCATQIEKGTSLLEEKKYEEAAEAFEKASKKSSMEKEAYRGLGISYYELKQFDRAKEAFETALEKGAEETPELYAMLGASCMEVGQYEEAASYFEKGSQSGEMEDSLKKEMLFNEISALEKAQKYAEAKEKADAYLKLYPDDETVQKEAEFLSTQAGNE
ncbi:MAG: tetratricopeptide repeat protein [Sellimonas sp.]|uniref:tetratricopeptide repeat protein n=1 Tax=Sellimonas sp. TaxID=2021466 RepID=UPI0039A23E69